MKTISNEVEELSHVDLELGVHSEIAKDIRKLESKLTRNRGFATFYRDKGLQIIERKRKQDAVIKATERAMRHRNEGDSEAYFVVVENLIAELVGEK